jgi:hypothetical protein
MKTRETTELSPATTERLQRWTNWLCDCWAPRGNNFFVVYPELAYLYLHLHTIIQPKLYDSQTVVSGFLKNKVKKIYEWIAFFLFLSLLTFCSVPSCLRTQILKLLHYRTYRTLWNMMLNANFFDFLFSEAHHRCGQEVTHGTLGNSSSTVNTDTALFLHPNITTTIQTLNTHVSLIVNT